MTHTHIYVIIIEQDQVVKMEMTKSIVQTPIPIGESRSLIS